MFTKWITGAALILITGSAVAQTKKDSLGLPGDNFDLYGALELFRKSENPEAFEKALNTNDNEINNLDLDADGKVDYIRVVDKTEGAIHSVVMQVNVSKDEVQDVAVIEIEKTGDKAAHIQIVGDEELYGKDYIVEPNNESSASSSKKGKESIASDTNDDDVYARSDESDNSDNVSRRSDNTNNSSGSGGVTVVNVWGWPSVQYIYGPSYVVWSSPWYWGYYPGWWDPWYPVYWRVYHRRVWHYHYPYYRRAYFYRSPAAHNYYYGRRATANRVREYNRNGYYHQRQQAYKANVQPGRRYNAAPANPRNRGHVREGRSNNQQPRNEMRSRQREQGVRSNTPRQQERSVSPRQRSGGAQQSTPRHVERQSAPRQKSGVRQQAPSGGNRGGSMSAPSSPRGSGGAGNSGSAPRGGGGGGGRGGR